MIVCMFVYNDLMLVRLEKDQHAVLHLFPATLPSDLPLVATMLPPTLTTTTPMGRWSSWSGALLLVSSGSWKLERRRWRGKKKVVGY